MEEIFINTIQDFNDYQGVETLRSEEHTSELQSQTFPGSRMPSSA